MNFAKETGLIKKGYSSEKNVILLTFEILEMSHYLNFIKSDSCRLEIVLSNFHDRNNRQQWRKAFSFEKRTLCGL